MREIIIEHPWVVGWPEFARCRDFKVPLSLAGDASPFLAIEHQWSMTGMQGRLWALPAISADCHGMAIQFSDA